MSDITKSVTKTLLGRGWIADCAGEIPDLDMAFDIQDQATAVVAAKRGGFAGFKIAFNSKMLMDKFSIPHPGMGRIFANQVYQSGQTLDAQNYANLMIEPEIAAVLGTDIMPGKTYSPADVETHVERYFPAFEILDRRNQEGMMHIPTVIAHNVFNAGIVVGGPGLPPSEVDFTAITTDCADNGEKVVHGQDIAPQHPSEALAFLANYFSARGIILPAGSLMLLGAHCPLYPVGAGRSMTLDLGVLGRVAFST